MSTSNPAAPTTPPKAPMLTLDEALSRLLAAAQALPAAEASLPVSQRIPAGSIGQPLQPGTAARIFTGAQVPPGADTIVMQEQATALDGSVRIDVVPTPGQWIRRRGEDV